MLKTPLICIGSRLGALSMTHRKVCSSPQESVIFALFLLISFFLVCSDNIENLGDVGHHDAKKNTYR